MLYTHNLLLKTTRKTLYRRSNKKFFEKNEPNKWSLKKKKKLNQPSGLLFFS